MTTNSKEVDDALRALETKHRTEDFLRKIGASDEAAALLASHPDQVKQFTWDGVNLHFGKSDLAAVDDPAAKSHFLEGPFAALFAKPVEPGTDGDQQVDPVVLASARAGNITDKGRLLRSLNGDVKALDAMLTAKGDGDDDAAAGANGVNGVNGHHSNPFLRLRDPKTGRVNPVVQDQVASLIKAVGTKRETAIARACKTTAAPFGMSITGLPLKG